MPIVRKPLSPADMGDTRDLIAIVKGLRWQLQHQRSFPVEQKETAASQVHEELDQGQGAVVYLSTQRATDRRQPRAPESMAAIFARLAGQGADPLQAKHCLDCPEPGKGQEHRAHISAVPERAPAGRNGLPEGSHQGKTARHSRSPGSQKALGTDPAEKKMPHRSHGDPKELGKRRA